MNFRNIVSFVFIFFFLFVASFVYAQEQKKPVRLFLFHSETCPHCKAEIKFLDQLKNKYPNLEVHEFEVSENFKNQSLFKNASQHYNLSGVVPVTIIGDKPIVGFDSESKIGKDIEKRIQECSNNVCSSWMDETLGLAKIESQGETTPSNVENNTNREIKFNLPGKEINLNKDSSIYTMGVVLGLADGVNPCMFSVLFFLLTYLIAIGSKKKAIKAGLAFVLTTFVAYFLFMFGIFKVIDILEIANFARWLIIIFAGLAGIVMIKDFFFYGKWFSLEIPEKAKPYIEALIKKGTIPSAILLALLSTIVELPCTSGLPLVYVSFLTAKNASVFGYLLLYNLFFVLPLVAIIFSVAFAEAKMEKWEAWRVRSRKYMRLTSGVLLLVLAFALWKVGNMSDFLKGMF